MNWQLRVGPPTAPAPPLTALTIHILSYDIFVGNTYYAIATFGTKIGSGETLLGSQKTELVTPCCHMATRGVFAGRRRPGSSSLGRFNKR
jgi:hypothetical protein